MNSFGAHPPPGMEWRIGKTAATIRFVEEAEAAFTTRSDLEERESYVLRTHSKC